GRCPCGAEDLPRGEASERVSPRAALHSPLSVSSPYASSFGMVPHATLNGELPAPSIYMGIHLSPQVSSAMMYGRAPMVSRWGTGPPCLHALALPVSPTVPHTRCP
uniref:Uncharacterized protein n=1 Tax=Strix occidentalis caurina TaxID=311401 RepID=A0A8D0KWI1_STROC